MSSKLTSDSSSVSQAAVCNKANVVSGFILPLCCSEKYL